MFKKKWNLSTQKIKPSKVASSIATLDIIVTFFDEYNNLKVNIPVKFIFNYDETSYNIINLPTTAIREKNSTVTKINYKGNNKDRFTLGLLISAGGAFLYPLLIAKGKTKRCLNKFNIDNKNVIGVNTINGWANDDCIILVLDQISKKFRQKVNHQY